MAHTPLHKINVPITQEQIDGDQKPHLEDLQGNILKSHGRDHAAHVFLVFKEGKAAEVRAWIKTVLKPRLVSAYKQLKDTENFRKTGEDSGVFQVFFLTARGYQYFGKDVTKLDATFGGGLSTDSRKYGIVFCLVISASAVYPDAPGGRMECRVRARTA